MSLCCKFSQRIFSVTIEYCQGGGNMVGPQRLHTGPKSSGFGRHRLQDSPANLKAMPAEEAISTSNILNLGGRQSLEIAVTTMKESTFINCLQAKNLFLLISNNHQTTILPL